MPKKKSKTTAINYKKYEITGVIFIALAVLCALSIYFDITSSFGDAVSTFVFGLFGISGFAFPVVMAVIGVLFIVSRKDNKDYRKMLLVVLVLILILSVLHVSVIEEYNFDTSDFAKYVGESFVVGSVDAAGGGVIGSLITYPVFILFGVVGSYITLFAAMAVVVVALTNLSLRTVGSNIGHAVKNQYQHYSAVREERRIAKNQQQLFVESLSETKEADTQEYIDNPFDIKIEAGENVINVEKVYKGKKSATKAKTDFSDADIMYNPDTFKEEDEAFVQDSLDFYNEGRRASAKVRKIKDDVIKKETSRRAVGSTSAAAVAASAVSDVVTDEQEVPFDEYTLENTESDIAENANSEPEYVFPPLSILRDGTQANVITAQEKRKNSELLEKTLADFGISAQVESVSVGPVVTRYEVKPAAGTKVSRIVNLSDDISLAFAVAGVRIEAPIPGKAAVGIEVPNEKRSGVVLKELLAAPEFKKLNSSTVFALGKDIAGKNIYADIRKMPHMLIAGETNAGKSVCVNSIIASILFSASPKDVKMIMIDPKMVELSEYNNIPHLLVPVVTDLKKAPAALQWAVNEMTMRYRMLAAHGAKEITSYNEKIVKEGKDPLPKLIIIIDEVAELMMANKKEVEDSICRIAQLGRAAGIHLIVATQRPSVDVITGVIKANIPSRIAFSVASQTDSRTILDRSGAEKLLGRGDMLFMPTGSPKPLRIQGCFIDENEIHELCEFLRKHGRPGYDNTVMETIKQDKKKEAALEEDEDDQTDPLFPQAVKLVIDSEQASISMLQRRFRVGYARAARLIDEMEIRGFVSGFEGSKPRQVIISKDQYEELFGADDESLGEDEI